MTLSDRLSREQVAWRPEAGDLVEGDIVELSERDSGYGGSYPLVVLEVADGTEVAIHCFHKVLRSELAKRRPAVGDRLAIKYVGKLPGKNYDMYRVALERNVSTETAPDWDRHQREAGEEMQLEDQYAIVPDDDAPPPTDDDAPPAAAHDEEVF